MSAARARRRAIRWARYRNRYDVGGWTMTGRAWVRHAAVAPWVYVRRQL